MANSIVQSARAILRPLKRLVRREWECPICGYVGPFFHLEAPYSVRRHVGCLRCKSFERHRLQRLVLDRIGPSLDLPSRAMLHVAPEPFFTDYFKPIVRDYQTADLERPDVDHRVDLRSLPFADGSFDMVYASHVFEHIDDDRAALAEVRRILRPGGVAILPVPIFQEKTIEYTAPNPHEVYHVRAPGPDYIDRYRPYFARIDVYKSDDFPEKYQTYSVEDRTIFPNEACPERLPMSGKRHLDYLPVCWI